MLPKLCHLDNDLVIIIIYILRSSHDSYTSPGDIFFLMVYPVWPWPVIKSTAGVWSEPRKRDRKRHRAATAN